MKDKDSLYEMVGHTGAVFFVAAAVTFFFINFGGAAILCGVLAYGFYEFGRIHTKIKQYKEHRQMVAETHKDTTES